MIYEIGTMLSLEENEIALDSQLTNENNGSKFKCRIVDTMKNRIIIDYPINVETNKIGFFIKGTKFIASFVGKDGAVYLFETKLVGRKKDNIPMLILEDPGLTNYKRIQRRNFVRVETSIDVAIHPISTNFKPFTTIALDLSGGGLAASLPPNSKFPQQGNIVCWLSLPMQSGEIYYIKSECKIIRVFKKKDTAREQVSLQFTNVGEKEQQKIIRYCFERQLFLKRN